MVEVIMNAAEILETEELKLLGVSAFTNHLKSVLRSFFDRLCNAYFKMLRSLQG
jgi:hypothetical protein